MGELIKPPNSFQHLVGPTVFLAGSIEMGVAEDWQSKISQTLVEIGWNVLNPRRDGWDSSWEQSIDNPRFKEQVSWELEGIERANAILFYFDPNTKSPITLMELGLVSQMKKRAWVFCPKGFWRKGNVDIVCERYGINCLDCGIDGLHEMMTMVQNHYSMILKWLEQSVLMFGVGKRRTSTRSELKTMTH